MYDLLKKFSCRPTPFSRYTAKELWTRPHLSAQMLAFHLDQETDLASRRNESIEKTVHWLNQKINLKGKSLCDLGCGPGLYAERFAALGAQVTGVDFSPVSLDYAKQNSCQSISYLQADYLNDDLPSGFDLVTLIYTDFCVLSASQRQRLLGRIKTMLNPEGVFVFDVAGVGGLLNKREESVIEENLMHGFWSKEHYIGMQKSFIYAEEKLSLDRYLIIQADEQWEIFNWFQHFSAESIESELLSAGFKLTHSSDGFSEESVKPDSELIGLIAKLKV